MTAEQIDQRQVLPTLYAESMNPEPVFAEQRHGLSSKANPFVGYLLQTLNEQLAPEHLNLYACTCLRDKQNAS